MNIIAPQPKIDIAETLKMIIKIADTALNIVSKILTEVAKKLGIIKTDESTIEIGDKAIQAKDKGIVPENYKTYDEYFKALNDFELNLDESAKISGKEKIEKGVEVLGNELQEKLNQPVLMLGLVLLSVLPISWFSTPVIAKLVEIIVNNPEVVNCIIGFTNGENLSDEQLSAACDVIADIVKINNPDLNEDETLLETLKYRNTQ